MAEAPLTATGFYEGSGGGSFGRRSELFLSTILQGEEAVLDEVQFTAPFKIMEPFREEKDYLKVMILSASPGIMEGDIQEQRIHVGRGTRLEVCSQSFEKIHRMKNGCARRYIRICQESDSFLYYVPQPAIPFRDSAFDNIVEVELEKESSRFIFQDILSCGRTAYGECFDYKYYNSLVQVRREGRLIYRDNTRYDPHTLCIAEIRERCAGVCHETRDWGAAWDEVLRAIRFYGMYQEQEALQSMSEDTRTCVRRVSFENTYDHRNNGGSSVVNRFTYNDGDWDWEQQKDSTGEQE